MLNLLGQDDLIKQRIEQRTRPLADDPNWKLRMFSGEAFESGNLASKMSEHVVTIST